MKVQFNNLTSNPLDQHWVAIVVPAHNEEAHLAVCLDSFVAQTRRPNELILVDDSSTDQTFGIAKSYANTHAWIRCVKHASIPGHKPGAKVVQAFNFGCTQLTQIPDFIGKFDADIVLPPNYFEHLLQAFGENQKLGICSGLVYIQQNDQWIYEPIAAKNHVRGPIKCYSQNCFEAIGGLKSAIGWDTADVLLARYHGFEVQTLADLQVKHLRPTGLAYSRENALKQGQALYTLRYGLILGVIASIKMAWKRKSGLLPWNHLKGAYNARKNRDPFLLSDDVARFARKWRWQQIREKLF
ncbi:MAG: hypothetical protein RLZZ241_545 [Bacteroidota bacterium]|jgi:glycosyltransferase involved in cell wall biosynthesis